jgi:hypothetical protein
VFVVDDVILLGYEIRASCDHHDGCCCDFSFCE